MTDNDWFSQGEGDINPAELQRRAEQLENLPDARPDENGLITIPVLPLRDALIFPHMLSPLYVGRDATLRAIEETHAQQLNMLALPQRDPELDRPRNQDFLGVGVEVAVSEVFATESEETAILVQGRRRIQVEGFAKIGTVLYARGRVVVDPPKPDNRQEALMRHLMGQFEQLAELNGNIPEDAVEFVIGLEEPGWLADMIASSFPLPLAERQNLLTQLDVTTRLETVTRLLARELEVLTIEEQIQTKMQDEADRGQRETYLREQMRAIQSELGDADPWTQELEELNLRIQQRGLPDEVKASAVKELGRLNQMPPMSPEVGVIRTYLDWILDLPWTVETEDNLDVEHAAKILGQNHFGLPKAKDRILEYIAVRSLKPKRNRQPILCFVGPPGTGKTSLGKSIADALGRKFVRLSLGGVRDEAEMRGHRRTYIGALPGRILQTMKRAETINPLFVLDEVDKLGIGYRGDPAAALLEVLDPEQNDTFSDHYLELPYDLSKVMFVTTANNRDEIPWALLDRMEVIEFPGYIEEEKLEIARTFLVGRQIEESGLEAGDIQFDDDALKSIIRLYTYEAGVRNLEREIGRVCRKTARLKAEKKKFASLITATVVAEFLGPAQFDESEAEREDEVGVATAIAWTNGGGDIMPIEVLLMDGKGNLQLTGQIGDVMQESAQAALSYLKSRAAEFNLPMDTFESTDVHVHIPEGAVPKDGPSAGITLATAIISAFTQRKVRRDVGMTGEITLRGKVLPIGGVREKVLAAHRSGLKTVILPAKNEKDIIDVPQKARDDLDLRFVSHMDEVLKLALLPADATTTPKRPARKAGAAKARPPAEEPPATSGV
ncbi:MAG: endopeptidase La [Anaerolineae bacterium]|nr:MAG: endopeptidase La [Anaerolineae bacterium]